MSAFKNAVIAQEPRVRKKYENHQLLQAGFLYAHGLSAREVEAKTSVSSETLRAYLTIDGLRREDYKLPVSPQDSGVLSLKSFSLEHRTVIAQLCRHHNASFDNIIMAIARSAFDVGFDFCINLIDEDVT